MANWNFDFESLLESASFQLDRIEAPSAWTGHIPFAAWVIRTVRPRIFVELGTQSGTSYLAFCQAAKAAQLTVKCFAVDTWQGDEHSGLYDETVFATLEAYNQAQYGKFSTLSRTRFDDAVGYFANGSIDLLHIDGFHTYEAVRHDFETWEPKLAPGAIVMLHDIKVREHGFGVWRLWEELKRRFHWNLEFVHCQGLGILCICDDDGFPGRDWLRPNSPIQPILQRYFASLGSHVEEGERYRRATAAAADLEGRLRGILSEREAEIGCLNDAVSVRDAGLTLAKAERDAERTRLNGELNAYVAELALLQKRFEKFSQSLSWQFVDGLVHIPRSVGRLSRWPFVRVAFHKNGRPRGWLQRLSVYSGSPQERTLLRGRSAELTSIEATLQIPRGPATVLDTQKATILVVAHEATRSGAPILALNLVQKLSARYNVISLVLGGGELVDHFRRASAALFLADRQGTTDEQLSVIIKEITGRHALLFGIVNSAESRMVLLALKAENVPTVSLIHEFAAYTRPRTAIPDVIMQSTETVFSTKITLENAISNSCLYPGRSIHLEPQGKCIVPAASIGAAETSIEKRWLMENLRPDGGQRKFLVIGVGNVELRKGVDLFIECATIIKNQKGGERFQFVWIGDGFDPERDGIYSVYLADQIKRGDVEPQVKILRSTSQIEVAYQAADLLLISSRLDPLPNVAIDALTLGLPVFCFEKTTGIADFLSEHGLKEQCVARYLDAHDLALKVRSLADSEELRAFIADRSRAAAEKAFNMNAYVSKIEAIALRAVGNEARVKEEVKTIQASGKFRSDFFDHPEVKSLPEEKRIENYLLRMALGASIRKPMPGFHPTVYSLGQKSDEWRDIDPFVEFLRKGLPEGPWLQRVIQNSEEETRISVAEPRTALHLHVFYPDQLAGIIERFNLNSSAPDLFISVVRSDAAAVTREAVSRYRGRLIDLQITPNLGRDLGPLLTQFGRALCTSYEVVGHLHTKKSPTSEIHCLGRRGMHSCWKT